MKLVKRANTVRHYNIHCKNNWNFILGQNMYVAVWLIWLCNQIKWRSLTAATVCENCRTNIKNAVAHCQPHFYFTFSIFNFQFNNHATVTVIVTLDVLFSASVTEYVTLYLPFRVVITLPKTSIFGVMSLPQVSTAVTPARA